MAKKADWLTIRTEYETSDTSYRKIADKYGVSFNTLKDHAVKEGWAKAKIDTHNKIARMTQQKTVVKVANKLADRNAWHIELYDKILQKVEKIIDEELNKHIDMFGGVHDSEVVKTDKLDQMARTLQTVQKGHRLALGLDKTDKDKTDNDTTTNIVVSWQDGSVVSGN